MIDVIALGAPALMAVGFYNHLHHNGIAPRQLVCMYGTFLVLVNVCAYLIYTYLFNITAIEFDNKTFITYSLLAVALAFVMPFVVRLIEATINIEVRPSNEHKT